MALPELTEHIYVHYAGSAVQHLFAVAAGLDSMVVGEAQILGQLRAAYAAAARPAPSGRVLHELAQQALRVGKRVHADTGIDTAGASVVSEALADAAQVLGGLAGAPRGARRRGRDGRAGRGALAAGGARRRSSCSTAPLARARRLAEITAEHGTPARADTLDALAAELAAADLSSPAPARSAPSWTSTPWRGRSPPAARSPSATSACRTTSTRPSPTCPACA